MGLPRVRTRGVNVHPRVRAGDFEQQAVLFYPYSPDLIALREHLLAKGVKVSSITYPEYMPKGEVCLDDPDGYVLLIGQAG